ncbi:MAG: pantoate--beta-alanine ligase [Candidatus Cloacimonetes bacterium]|nr:pantoate--beta-alanine ligase [Candidatus Cloacimonadota bacterium]
MRIIKSVAEMRKVTNSLTWKSKVGFVPTMGALHKGHISLAEAARKECKIVVMSIYVNPSQFAPNEDLDSYPRTLRSDLELAENAGVDYIFLPTDAEMYPEGYKTWVNVEEITDILCGATRSGHFRGVTTIVTKLMNLIKPDFMYMGEKDFQQVAVLKKMIEDLNISTVIKACPTVRESDGLAMSSRNTYLSPEERKQALCLNLSMKQAAALYQRGETSLTVIRNSMTEIILANQGRIDYIEFVDRDTLAVKESADDKTRIVLAVFIGKTRLIDNGDLV